MFEELTAAEFVRRLRYDREGLSLLTGPVGVVVDGQLTGVSTAEMATLPCVVLAMAPDPVVDAVVDTVQLASVRLAAERHPQALVATAVLLRGVENRTVAESLVAESTTYSLLQGGAEFRAWREARPRPAGADVPSEDDCVIVVRDGGSLTIELNRPTRRNAYSWEMRNRLSEALATALLDDSVETVVLRGRGTNFSSGGDLDQFGSFGSPVESHLSRLTSSVAWQLHTLRDRIGSRLVCEVHGANFGAGVELPAFCGRVVARSDATFCLPEVGLGLVPGAGGTASIPARIGRQRTALMALTAQPIDATTAFAWGLVDEIVP